MIETGQLLEKYRQLSRDLQNGLQSLDKFVDELKNQIDTKSYDKLDKMVSQISDSWQDFSDWILISTLDNLQEAKANCTPGLIDIRSKIERAKIKHQPSSAQKRIKLAIHNCKAFKIETFIPYFEQVIDLILINAIKYSPHSGQVEISTSSTQDNISIEFSSLGPMMNSSEVNSIGLKGFRSETAKKLHVSGQGYGLFNAIRLAKLLECDLKIFPKLTSVVNLNGVPFSTFTVHLIMPKELKYK
jgi:signal transduction histidine kinase